MSSNELETQSEMLQTAVFQQIQECGDVISSILLTVKFIQENNISVGFKPSKLRHIALRSVDSDTNTYLWHINALIAASSDFDHLLIGIEMMFDRFLGNHACFMKEKKKRQENNEVVAESTASTALVTPAKPSKFLGTEIVSFVNSYYDDREDLDTPKAPKGMGMDVSAKAGLAVVTEDVATNMQDERVQEESTNDENRNCQNANRSKVEESAEFMQKYRGKISSPISFRMRHQKRMMQSERRGSQVNSRNVSMLSFNDSTAFNESAEFDIHTMGMSFEEPQISSPFNVSKFAKAVDLGPEEQEEDMMV